jgi:hypothetical protein
MPFFVLLVFVVVIVLIGVFMKNDNSGNGAKQQSDRRAEMDANLNPNDPRDVCYAMAVLAMSIYHVSRERMVHFYANTYYQKNKTNVDITEPELKEKEIHPKPTLDDYAKLKVPESIARFLIAIPGLKSSTKSWSSEVEGFEVELDSALTEKEIKRQIYRAHERFNLSEFFKNETIRVSPIDQGQFISWYLDG